jgi:hypothetical protein
MPGCLLDTCVVDDLRHDLRQLEAILRGGCGAEVLEVAEARSARQHVEQLDMAGFGLARSRSRCSACAQVAEISPHGERRRS